MYGVGCQDPKFSVEACQDLGCEIRGFGGYVLSSMETLKWKKWNMAWQLGLPRLRQICGGIFPKLPNPEWV